MKFVKGVMIGGIITTGMFMIWNDSDMNTKKITKKSKKWAKKMGII